MSVCSGMRSLLQGHPEERISINEAPSRKPCTCRPATVQPAVLAPSSGQRAVIAAIASREFMAPIAPAEHPPKSSLWPGVLPMPRSVTSCVMTALKIRAPRNAKFHVAGLAARSPDQRSEEQSVEEASEGRQSESAREDAHLMYTLFASPQALAFGAVEKMPYCAISDALQFAVQESDNRNGDGEAAAASGYPGLHRGHAPRRARHPVIS